MTIKIKQLDSDLPELNTIFHISDIHIRKRTRHNEYLSIFDRFCDIVNDHIRKHGNDCIILVTGDVMHDKTELVPESIDVLKRFIIKLSDVTEVVIIIGNHDTNIFNKDSLDCLTPIVSDLYTRNRVHLLNENAVYVYGEFDVLFGVTTLWSSQVTPINDEVLKDVERSTSKSTSKFTSSKNGRDDQYIKIALYHGTLHGSTLDNGTKALNIESRSNCTYFNQTDFKDYDYVMLGDVHKHQFLNKARTIAYAGSLIQQKRDEDLLEHGTIVWDIRKKRASFVRVKNNFGMIQVKVGSTKADVAKLNKQLTESYQNSDLPKNLDIKMIYSSMEGKKMFKSTFDTIFKKHHIVKSTEITDTSNMDALTIDTDMLNSITFGKTEHKDRSLGNNNEKIDRTTKKSNNGPLKITDNDAVVKIMMEHIAKQKIVDTNFDKIKSSMRNEVTSILEDIDYNYDADVKNITLKSIEFNNMFIYVEGSKIDFEKFNNIVGLNASNYRGKSSFIDIILYSIYGECSRGRRFDVLNIKRKKMDSRIVIDVNGVEYIVARTSSINSLTSRDLKENVTVWEDGVNITADDRVKTHQMIAKKICSYDDIVNNSFVLQKNGRSFVDLPDKNKKDLLCKMARFDVFDKIFVEAKSRHFSVGQSLGRSLKKLENYDDYLVNTENDTHHTKSTSVKRRSITSSIDDKIKNIESSFTVRRKALNGSVQRLDESIKVIERKISDLEAQKNEIDRNLSVHKVKSELYHGFEDEKQQFNLKCRELIKMFNLSIGIKSKLTEYTKGESVEQIALTYASEIADRDRRMNIINNAIETNLKNLTKIEYDINDVSLSEKSEDCNDPRDVMIKSVDVLSKSLDTANAKLQSMMRERANIQQEITDMTNVIDRFDKIEERYKTKMTYSDSIKRLENELSDLSTNIKRDTLRLNELKTHEYNPECDKCMKNPVTKELLNTKKSLKQTRDKIVDTERTLRDLKTKLNRYDEKGVDGVSIIDKEYTYGRDCLQRKQNTLLDLERIDNKIDMQKKDSMIIQTKLDTLKSAVKNIDQNKKIEKKIEELRTELNELKSFTDDRYEKIKIVDTKLKTIESQIGNSLAELNLMAVKRSKTAGIYNKIALESIEMLFCEEKVSKLKTKIESLNRILQKKRAELNTLHTSVIKLDFDIEKFNEIKNEVETVEMRRTVLEYIKKVLDKNGLVDTLLTKNIIPYLQNNINRILSEVGHYQIEVEYKNQSVNIYKKNIDDVRGLNVTMSSGYESYLLDLVFRLALAQINNHIKTNFLIIDEGFNACDSENKNNVKELLEFMRSYYSWILIVSHDEFIKSFYDMNIMIQSVKDGSRIQNIQTKKDDKNTYFDE